MILLIKQKLCELPMIRGEKNMTRRNSGVLVQRIVGIIFLLVGIGTGLLGIFVYRSDSELADGAVELEATISYIESYYDSDDDLSHRAYVDFEYDGKQYSDYNLNSYNSGMHEGKSVTILYNPDMDEIIKKGSQYEILMFMLGMGIVFVIMAVGMLISSFSRKTQYVENPHKSDIWN